MPRRTPIEDRFWKFVDKTDGGCWLWTGATVRGYGRVSYQRRSSLAHRVAWLLLRGTIPEGIDVCHNCPGGDNPLCVNPAHMFLGDRKDNMQDAARKGRTSRGARHSAIMLPLVQHGEERPLAKLTDAIVMAMRRRVAGGDTIGHVAREHGVHRNTAMKAVRHLTWRHVA